MSSFACVRPTRPDCARSMRSTIAFLSSSRVWQMRCQMANASPSLPDWMSHQSRVSQRWMVFR
eukprot:3549998-Heterocapsa_arctica.AAC.1